ncbi:MAG: adenylyl-sulfate kinase [Arcobacter sp.]|uniref:adenylyl-sulfate kinase n=1 Tax=uncultured Arcobacter sp. TaxID=165434 RepID=UPI000CC35A26|nr:adenylyl-sulfate kinase [uncultured Arcobacter sp.]PLY08709.1 MAG: adenylyl-sulfate kinase [Arcobacter sp.]
MVIWITGLSGSGKTTISREVYNSLKEDYPNTVLLDGDIIREALNHSYGYTIEERRVGARQIHGLCNMLDKEGMIVICATMSLFYEIHELNRNKFSNYIEVFLDVDMDELVKRDKKQLYSKALCGTEDNVVGVTLDYDQPKTPHLHLTNNKVEERIKNTGLILNSIKKLLKKN